MKKLLIFIAFIFVFLSCSLTSFEFNNSEINQTSANPQITASCASVENSEISTDYYIATATNLNLSQYLENLFSNICTALENNTYRKLHLYLVFEHWQIFNPSGLLISTVLNPRAP